VEGDGRIETKTKSKRCKDMVNLITHHDSWQMVLSITEISLSPNLPELGISILTMSTMGGYYAMGNYMEGHLLYHQTVFLMLCVRRGAQMELQPVARTAVHCLRDY
jgi:hypothetical protein